MNLKNLIELCSEHDVKLTKKQAEKLEFFCNFLLKKNTEFNLTAIVDLKEIVVKHFVDSLKLEKLVKLNLGTNLLDIGAGAGFPSVPLAIVRSDLKIMQLDCLKKRVNFLKQVADLLNLNVSVFHGRAEELGRKLSFREQFQFVTARAVANLNRLLEYALPFVVVGGFFIALKGRNYDQELNNSKQAIAKLGGKLEKVEEYSLGCDVKRCLILIKKISQTPTQYPRINSKILKYSL